MELKREAVKIFLGALGAIDIRRRMRQEIKLEGSCLKVGHDRVDLSGYREIVAVGFGKASMKMGAALESILGDRITRGVLVTDRQHALKVKLEVVVGGHPLPDEGSLRAGKRVLELVSSCGSRSLMIFLISGGGSALVEAPIWDDVTLEDLQKINHILITCGANISEINTIRKYLSRTKGGRLGALAAAPSVAIYVSDVNPGDLYSIASNPLLEDEASLEDFFSVLEKYDLLPRLPKSIAARIERGQLPELPKGVPGPLASLLLLDNGDALRAAAEVARQRGFQPVIEWGFIEGPYRRIADALLGRLLELRRDLPDRPICLISGGEVSCPVRGDGIGGRNQEFVLYCAARMSDLDFPAAVLSCGTDGIDGNSAAAGAVADQDTARLAARLGLSAADYLRRNDSNSFFKRVGGLIVTGPTGNNVRDVRLFLTTP
jgi:glycerate-2-kinase